MYKSDFTRRLHALTDTILALFALVGDLLKHLNTEARYVLDSFLVAVYHKMRQKYLGRIPRCKLLTGKAYHGRYASKRSWFYGLKVPPVAGGDGRHLEFHTSQSRLDGAACRWTYPQAVCAVPMRVTPTMGPKTCSTRPAEAGSKRRAARIASGPIIPRKAF